MHDWSTVMVAFGLTVFAGGATAIGSAIAFFARRTNYRFLSIALGFSGGVMLYVSFTEILVKSHEALSESHGELWGSWLAVISFFVGIAVIGIIDRLVPKDENPHEPPADARLAELAAAPSAREPSSGGVHNPRLLRMGIVSALAIAIHNFPEGLATFLAALDDPHLGVAIAIAVALHNIPEGISVSVPVYYATGSKRRAFLLSALSGASEPVGALLGWVVLQAFVSPALMGYLFGAVAGIMVFISLDELLPTAREYGRGHDSLYGLVAGMAVMAVSLLLLK
ncbi:MAG TPA: zinc transporter ZupT [Chthonomonadales bacterium]|nr:zinc transporter ZupT [Chthonomonadales bacterium]